MHPPNTLTQNAYIVTDNMTADFTWSLLAPPNVFQFTDTTTPTPTAWAWDFNGDNIVDSTLQNPVTVLAPCTAHRVQGRHRRSRARH